MAIAHVFIDGFNLYKGALEKSPAKWLNLEAWCDRLLPSHSVERIVYCTARVVSRPHDPSAHTRQDAYLRALTSLPRVEVLEGTFKVNDTRMPRVPLATCDCCQGVLQSCACCYDPLVKVTKTEEKGSDVNLAVQLLRGAYRGDYGVALVVSGDSDIQPSIDIVCNELNLPVIVADPRNRRYRPLKGSEFRNVRPAALAASQFPQTVMLPDSTSVSKPATWP